MPAIHFEASRSKARAWRTWVAALPRARLQKQALEAERQNVLGKQRLLGLSFVRQLLTLLPPSSYLQDLAGFLSRQNES